MVIDFHTHTFPDMLAERAISNLEKSGGVKRAIDGKVQDILNEMKQSGVNLSVILPILTQPKHFDSINNFAFDLNQKKCGLLSFASVHPESSNLKSEIKKLKDMGFVGVKIHPLFQNFDIDSIESERMIGLLCEENFIISIHAGYDVSYPNSINAIPDKLLKMVKDVMPTKTVFAHMGAACYWEESLEKLTPLDVYFDTSYAIDEMDSDLFLKIVKAKGVDKVLFGTDSPWKSQTKYLELFDKLMLSNEDKEKILHQNAEKLLGVKG